MVTLVDDLVKKIWWFIIKFKYAKFALFFDTLTEFLNLLKSSCTGKPVKIDIFTAFKKYATFRSLMYH